MHRAFLGDRERTFALSVPQIEALEKATGSAIGAIFGRFRRLEFSFADLTHTIRLALIGGGETPNEAADLITQYVAPRPFAETLPIAMAVIEIVMFGSASTTDTDNG